MRVTVLLPHGLVSIVRLSHGHSLLCASRGPKDSLHEKSLSCPGRSAARSGALQTRDRSGPWRSRISGAALWRCTASGTQKAESRRCSHHARGAGIAAARLVVELVDLVEDLVAPRLP